jgi:hypothetical protein
VRSKVVSVTVLTAAVVAGTATGATPPAQIRITDVQASYRYVHSAGDGPAGALEFVRQRLYNPRISGKQIGRADLVCTYIDAQARTCTGTYTLPKGSLVVEGVIQSRLLYEIAVIGGTGLYDNARGSLTVTSTALRPKRREVLLFRLVG